MFRLALYSRLLSPFGTRECHKIQPCTVRSFTPTEACLRFSRTSLFRRSFTRPDARYAICSTPVVAMFPPLSVGSVSIQQSTVCAPLRSVGVTPLPHDYESIRLPKQHQASFQFSGCATLPHRLGTAWDLPSSRLCLGDVLRS